MTELLTIIAEYLWIGIFIAFCILGALAIQQRQNTSSFMTLGIVTIISGTIFHYEKFVLSFTDPTTSTHIFLLWCLGFVMLDCVLAYVFYRLFGKLKNWTDNIKAHRAYVFLAIGFTFSVVISQYGTLALGSGGISYKVWIILSYYLGSCLFYGLAIYAIMKAHELTGKMHMLIARTYILAFSVASVLQIITLNEQYFFETNTLGALYRWGLVSINIGTTAVAVIVSLLAVLQYITETKRKGWLWTL